MKKGLIVFLVFAVVLVIGLMLTGVFSKPSLYNLSVKSTNTTIVVKDNYGQVVSNNSASLESGETYTVTVTPYENCILQYFTINDINYINRLENNQCTFVCNGATIIKAIAMVDPTLEEPPVIGITKLHSATYSACQILGPGASVRNVDDVTLILCDSTDSVVARLGVGDTFDLLVEDSEYTVKYSSDTAYKNVKITNTSIDFKYHTFPYTFTAKANSNLKITSFNSALMSVIPDGVFIVGNNGETSEFVVGESYTLSDNAPEGFKTNLYVNNQLVQLPYTFTYTEDIIFDFEIVENATEEYTTNTFNLENTHFVLTQYHTEGGYHETHDCPNGIDNFQFEVGGTYCLEITPDDGYQLVEASYNSVTFWTGLESGTLAFSFVVVENAVFEVNAQPYTTITPTITITGYNGDFSNIGVVKFRTDSSVTNYIYDNLIVGEMYLITVGLYASALSNYYISGIYVNGILVGADYSEDTLSMEVGAYKVTSPFNITIEITRK